MSDHTDQQSLRLSVVVPTATILLDASSNIEPSFRKDIPMRTVLIATCLLTCSSLSAEVFAAEGYWNQFRGPHANGTSEAKGLPLKFAEGSDEVVWKTEVKGRAWSTPVVWGDQIWVTNAPEIINPEGATNQD